MPLYRYKAYTPDGAIKEGSIEAASNAVAVEMLYEQNLVPFLTSETVGENAERWWNREIFSFGSVSQSNLAEFTRELATLVSAELPLDEALRMLSSQSQSGPMRSLATSLLEKVMDGASFSQALFAKPDIFPGYYVSMVRAGEAAGSLGAVFEDLAHYLERRIEVRAKINSALIYPVILLVTAIVAIAIIMSVLIPRLAPLFDGTGRPPPLPIRVFEALDATLATHWPALLVGSALAVLAIIYILRLERVASAIDRAKLNLPLIGGLVAKSEAATFARTLGSLLRSGVSLLPALQIVRSVSKNRSVVTALTGVVEEVREGAALAAPLERAGVFPAFALRLIAVGEESGRLDEMLLHAARIFEVQVQRQVDRLMSLMTPLLTLIIGLGVGGLLMSVMNAIMSVNDLAF